MKLYICATPIGNLQEASFRLLEVLRSCELIAAEDTRRTRKLLSFYEIDTPLLHYSDHHGAKGLEALIRHLKEGKSAALVSDAGMPLISDPGYELVQRLLQEGIEWEVISGPSALINALVLSGLPTQNFYFEGFLPRKASERKRRLAAVRELEATLIFYEAPTRLAATLRDMTEVFGERQCSLSRELSKLHEETVRLPISQMLEKYENEPPKGEIVLVVQGKQPQPLGGSAEEALRELLKIGFDKKEAVKLVAAERGIPKREVYKAALELEDE